MEEFRAAVRYVSVEKRLTLLEILATLLNDMADEDASRLARSILKTLKPDEL